MGTAAGMKDIVQNIVASREARASEIDGLKSEVEKLKKEASEMVGSFKASRDDMDTQMRKALAQGEAARFQSWLIGVLGYI